MKAKELAERLLENPDLDVELEICTRYPTYDNPWATFKSYKVNGVNVVAGEDGNELFGLEVEELEEYSL